MDVSEILSASSLFDGVSEHTRSFALDVGIPRSFAEGERLCLGGGCLCLILSGTVRVSGAAREKTLVLNTLGSGDCFGAASLFGETCGVTVLTAEKAAELLLFSQEAVELLLQSDSIFARNYICFLTRKIGFLNRKIAAFTAGSAEKKLARYLLLLPDEGGWVTLPMPMAKLAGALDLGRASLYRAFAFLEESGLLRRSGSTVFIPAPGELKKLYGGSM